MRYTNLLLLTYLLLTPRKMAEKERRVTEILVSHSYRKRCSEGVRHWENSESRMALFTVQTSAKGGLSPWALSLFMELATTFLRFLYPAVVKIL